MPTACCKIIFRVFSLIFRNNVSSDGGGGSSGNGTVAENPHLLLLFYLAQLFLRELFKSYRLIQVVPMDMSGYYGSYILLSTEKQKDPAQFV